MTANHTEWDCWYNPKNPKPEAVAKRKAKAAAKPKGGSKGKGKKGGKKGLKSLEEQEWPDDAAQEPEGEDGNVESLFMLHADGEADYETSVQEGYVTKCPRDHELKCKWISEEWCCSVCEKCIPGSPQNPAFFLSCGPCEYDCCWEFFRYVD